MPGSLTQTLRSGFVRVDPFDCAAGLLLVALVAAIPFLTPDYAISNDEGVQHRYGELILAYYASGFTDLSVFRFQNLHLYGGLFDILAVLIGRIT